MIGILTHDMKHRETYGILCLLKAGGVKAVDVFAVPFYHVKTYKPLLEQGYLP